MKDDTQIRALAATQKPALYGEDLDLGQFQEDAVKHPNIDRLAQMPDGEQSDLRSAGMEIEEQARTGSYVQKDHSVIYSACHQPGLEVLPIGQALDRYPWLEEYYWRLVAVDTDKYTARAELHREHGYFIRALPGVKAIFPVQACLYITQEGLVQDVHNIIIAEEESELHVITGCTTAQGIGSGVHVGISEFYVKSNARLSFTMVHNWAEHVEVRPRSGARVEAGGVFLSNYVCMRPVRSLQMYPTAYLEGAHSLARFHSILVGQPGSTLDVGSRIVLRAEGTRAESIARSITRGGQIMNRGHLIGEAAGSRGHLECRGLMLGSGGMIYAVPELEARIDGVDLSHEAAVGKIAEEEIEYLMARGLKEEEATAIIVRGFLNIRIMGLPPELESEINRAIEISEQAYL